MAEGLDRLSRDQEHSAALYKRACYHETIIFTLSEGEVEEWHVGIKSVINAAYLTDLAMKTRRGLRGRVLAGASAGGLSYGYDVVPVPEGADRGLRAINPAQAAVVVRILRDYAGGVSPKAIAAALNREGVPGPRGGTWSQSTIYGNRTRGTGILNNELYIGILVWNRLRYVKDPDNKKRHSRPNAPDKIVRVEVLQLSLVGRGPLESGEGSAGRARRGRRGDRGHAGEAAVLAAAAADVPAVRADPLRIVRRRHVGDQRHARRLLERTQQGRGGLHQPAHDQAERAGGDRAGCAADAADVAGRLRRLRARLHRGVERGAEGARGGAGGRREELKRVTRKIDNLVGCDR